MRHGTMPGEVRLSSDCKGGNFNLSEDMGDPNRKLEEMAEKLEKSEAGRKKLRQAIALLKEKLGATEKVLQVNEILRQECEEERLRAETERKKAEEEKTLRLQIEKESLSVKEQLVGVLQRLEAVERNSKSDRAEALRARGEMELALSALSGALQVAEAAQSSLQGLEKTIQDKVNSAVSTSTRALSLAQSVTSDVKSAQGAASSAEKSSQALLSRLAVVQKQSAGLDQRVNLLQQETSKALSLAQSVSSDAKAAQVAAALVKESSQSLVSRVAAVQKQSAGLDQRVNLLQQELRTRFVDVGASFSGARTVNGAVPCMGKESNKGMVLSKSQQPTRARTDNLKPPLRNSVVGSSVLNHDTVQRESVVGLSGRCVQPKSHLLESIQLVDSGSSSGCTTTLSRELEPSVKNKVTKLTREPIAATVSKRTTSPLLSNSAPRLQTPANTPVSQICHSRSAKSTFGQGGIHSGPKLGNEVVGRETVDSSGSFPASGDHIESLLSNVDNGIGQISALTHRKVLSKKRLAARPINSDFCGRPTMCGGVNTEEDNAQTLRVTDAERGLKSFDVGEEKIAKGRRKVKLPAALLKDITKLFSKGKNVQFKLEAKFLALEQMLRSGCEKGTFSEQLLPEDTRKRKREKASDRKSKKGLRIDGGQNLEKRTRGDTAPRCGVEQPVGDCSGAVGRRVLNQGTPARRTRSKDASTGDPSTPVQSTPPFAVPKVSDSVVVGSTMTAKLQEQYCKEDFGREIVAVLSVSDSSDGERCRGLDTQLGKGIGLDAGIGCDGVKWCRDGAVDMGGTKQCIVTCSSLIPERVGMCGNSKVVHMDIDMGPDKSADQILEGTGNGWDTGSDFSDDEFDREWWTTERVLLSPTLPELQPSALSEGTPLDAGLAVSDLKEMSFEDMALFLDVLPPVTGERCEIELKDAELQYLSGTHTPDESIPENTWAHMSISPKSGDVEVPRGGKGSQNGDDWDNYGGLGVCSTSLVSGSFTLTPDRERKVRGTRQEEDKGNMLTDVVGSKVISNQHQIDITGGLKTPDQLQTCIPVWTVDSKLEIQEGDGSLQEEDKENMITDGNDSRGSVQVTGLRSIDSVLLPQETNIVPTICSPGNLQKSLNYESGDEAVGNRAMEPQFRILTATVDSNQESSGMEGSLENEDKENIVRDGAASGNPVQITGFRPINSMLLPQEANTVPILGIPPTLQRSLNCESGDEARGLESQVPILTLPVDSKIEITGMDGGLEKEDPENIVGYGIASRGCVQFTGLQSSDPVLPAKGTNIVPTTDSPATLQRSLHCEPGKEGRGVEKTEFTAEIGNGYRGAHCEGEAKSNPLYGLKLIAGLSGEHKSINLTEVDINNRQQISWRVQEIASVVGWTRDFLVHALKHDNTCEVKSWMASSDLSSMLAKTRLSGMNLLSIFTASLIDAYGWWEIESSASAPPQCRSFQFLLVLVSEVFKADVFQQVFASEFQIVNVLAHQLQEFLIQGTVGPVSFLGVKTTFGDGGEEVIIFQIPSPTSDIGKMRTVASASTLLASLCLGIRKTDHLRKSVYLILRHCNMDSSWLLGSISSFATVCGTQLFSAGAGDIAAQATLVVVSELLNDAEETNATGKKTLLTDSSPGSANDACERQGKDPYASDRQEPVVVSKIFSANLRTLREFVGKFENDLNFEAFLPKILQLFVDVLSPNSIMNFSDSQQFSSDPARVTLRNESGGSFGACGVSSESSVSAYAVDGALPQPCQNVELKDMDAFCWQCSYSSNDISKSAFAKGMDAGTTGGDPFILKEQKFHKITHALELVACHLGWEWTYNDLIVEHLWKRVYSGASDMTVVFVAKSLGIFGRLGIEIDGTELQGVAELRRILTAILRSGHQVAGVDGGSCPFSFTAQVTAAESLLNLSRGAKADTENTLASASTSHASILAWLYGLDPVSLDSLPLSLRSLLPNF